MAHRRYRVWRVAIGAIAGGVLVWGVLRFGALVWLGDEAHPARPVVEALSWLAGILGFLIAVAALVIAMHGETRPADSDPAKPTDQQGSATNKYVVDVRDSKAVQVGDDNTQTNNFGA